MSKRQKTLIPTSSDFLSSLPGPAYKLLESYVNNPHDCSNILLNLKCLNHANYDAYHRHINTSIKIDVTYVADVKRHLKSSHMFEKFTILDLMEFGIDTWNERTNKSMSKELPLLSELMDTFSASKHLVLSFYTFNEGYQSVLNNFLNKNGDRFPNVTVRLNYPKLKTMEIHPAISELHVSCYECIYNKTFKVCDGHNDKINRGASIVDSSSLNKLTTLVLGAVSADQLNFFWKSFPNLKEAEVDLSQCSPTEVSIGLIRKLKLETLTCRGPTPWKALRPHFQHLTRLKTFVCDGIVDFPSAGDFFQKHWPMMSTLESFTMGDESSYGFIHVVDFSNMLKLNEVFNAIPKHPGCVSIRKVSLSMSDDRAIDANEVMRRCPNLNDLSLHVSCSNPALTLNDTHGSLERLNVEGFESCKLCVAAPNLKVAKLNDMKIENDSIEHLLEHCPQLTSLELHCFPEIDPSTIDERKFATLKRVLIWD